MLCWSCRMYAALKRTIKYSLTMKFKPANSHKKQQPAYIMFTQQLKRKKIRRCLVKMSRAMSNSKTEEKRKEAMMRLNDDSYLFHVEFWHWCYSRTFASVISVCRPIMDHQNRQQYQFQHFSLISLLLSITTDT